MILYTAEYEYLTEQLKEKSGMFSAVLIHGDYGKGKTELIRQVLENINLPNMYVCKLPGMNTPFEELSSALFQKLEDGCYDITNINSEISHREYLKQLFIKICRQTPDIVVVFHDIRDYNKTSIEMIKEILHYLKQHHIACHIIMEYSTNALPFEQRDDFLICTSLCTMTEIKLGTEDLKIYEPLLLSLLPGKHAITPDQIKSVITEAFFNPALIKKMVYFFIDVGIFFQRDECWYSDEIDFHLTAKLFEKNIYERYEKLDDKLKATINKACITGYEINPKLLYQPLGIIKSEDNLRRIERLSRLITRTENTYCFENNTVYNLINDKIGFSEKKTLHLLVANYLYEKIEYYAKNNFSNMLRLLDTIKNHYINAEHIEEALHSASCYIAYAYCNRNYDAALCGIKDFFDLSSGSHPFVEQQFIYLESEIYCILGKFDIAYEKLMTINNKYLPLNFRYWVTYAAAYSLFNCGRTEEAKKRADELTEKFDSKQIEDPLLLVKLDILLSGMYHHFGNVRYASRRYEQALSIAGRSSVYRKEYYYLLSISNMFLDNIIAIQKIEESMRYFEEKQLMTSYAKSANNVAINYIYIGDFETAAVKLKKSHKIFDDICSLSSHYPLNNLATVYGSMQNYQKAEELFRASLKIITEPFSVLWIQINIAHCRRKCGDFSGCKHILNDIKNKIDKIRENTYLLMRNYYIADGLLQFDGENYSAAYERLLEALNTEICLLENDTYPIFLSRLLLDISNITQQPFPDIAMPYKDSYITPFIQNLLDNKTHWGNFLFWEI